MSRRARRLGHTVEGLADETIRGLLRSQEEALEVVFGDVRSGRPLTRHNALRVASAPDPVSGHGHRDHTGITPWGTRI